MDRGQRSCDPCAVRRRLCITCCAVLLLALLPGVDAAAKPGWKHVLREDGVTVSTREVPGRGFPTFRGVGVIHAGIFDVLAVISDIKRYPQWVESCKEARLLKKINELERMIYQRTDVPWPISDRDSVNRSLAVVDLKRQRVNIKFWAIKSKRKPPVDGVVRMVKLRGHYLLTALGANKTRIDFKVDADPGGLLPTWLAKLATRRLPLKSIQGLRKQVRRTKGWYAKRIKRWKTMKF
jgi:hypothetical protein